MADNSDFDTEERYRHSIENIPVSESDYLPSLDDESDIPCQDEPFDLSFGDYGTGVPPVSSGNSFQKSRNSYDAGNSVARKSGLQNPSRGYPEHASGRTGNDNSDVTYLNVPFSEKDEAKALGARWDKNARKWYVPAGIPLEPFSRWI